MKQHVDNASTQRPKRRHQPSRRLFLGGGIAGATAAVIHAPRLLRAENLNSRLRLACIGVGGRGGKNLLEMTKSSNDVAVDIVALCDVDSRALDRSGAQHPKAKQFRDFRTISNYFKENCG